MTNPKVLESVRRATQMYFEEEISYLASYLRDYGETPGGMMYDPDGDQQTYDFMATHFLFVEGMSEDEKWDAVNEYMKMVVHIEHSLEKLYKIRG